MKLDKYPGKDKRGICLVCGKPTSIGDHRPCSEYMINRNAVEKRRKESAYCRARRHYLKGKTPGVTE